MNASIYDRRDQSMSKEIDYYYVDELRDRADYSHYDSYG